LITSAKRGFAVSAPEWPRKQGDVEQLRETAEQSAGLGVQEIVGHYERARRPAGADRTLGRRLVRRVAARPRPRPRRGGDEPGAAEGHSRAPLFDVEGQLAGAGAPVEVARRRDLDARAVHVRLRQHFSAADAAAAYERYAVPETGQIFYEAGFANFHLHPPTETATS
jgi:hypothetical protein